MGSEILPILFAILLAVAAAAGLVTLDSIALRVVVVASAVLASGVILLGKRIRVRELVLWLVILSAVLNFTPALFEAENIVPENSPILLAKDLTLVLLAVTAVFVRGPQPTRSVLPFNRTLVAWIFLVGILASVTLARVGTDALPGLVASIRFYVFYPLTALVVWRLDLSRSEIIRVLRLVLALGVFESILGALHVFGYLGVTSEYARPLNLFGQTIPRAIGTLGNPNNFAVFLALPLLLVVKTLEGRGDARVIRRGTALWLLPVLLVGTALSYSATSAIGIGIALVAQSRMANTRFRWGLLVGLAAALVTVLVLEREVATRALGSRPEAQTSALSTWLDNPTTFAFGLGLGSPEAFVTPAAGQEAAVDNMVLVLALEGGIIALLVGAALLAAAARAFIVVSRRKASDAVVQGASAFAIFFLLNIPLRANLRLIPAALLFWILLAFVGTLDVESRSRSLLPGLTSDSDTSPERPTPTGVRRRRAVS